MCRQVVAKLLLLAVAGADEAAVLSAQQHVKIPAGSMEEGSEASWGDQMSCLQVRKVSEESCAKSPNPAYGVYEDPCCENLQGPGCNGQVPVGCAAGGLPQRCRYCFLPGSALNDGSLPVCSGSDDSGEKEDEEAVHNKCPFPKSPTARWPKCLKRLPITSFVPKYGAKWLDLIKKMKKTPALQFDGKEIAPRYRNLTWYELLVVIHGTNYPEDTFAHMGTEFGTWHRVLLWLMDYGLNQVSDANETIVSPYWDWTSGTETTAVFEWTGRDGNPFDHQCIPGPFAWPIFNITVMNEFYPHGVKQWQCIKRGISQDGISSVDIQMAAHYPTLGEVQRLMMVPRYDNNPYDHGAMGSLGFVPVLEGSSGYDNEGNNFVENGQAFHGFHNIVHLNIGQTMATLTSLNDPIFWTHHGNVDRVLQSWLVQTGDLYGTGPPTREGDTPLTRGFPAQILKVDPQCHGLNVTMNVNALPGYGVMFKFGDGSAADWTKFLLCSYGRDPSGKQIVGGGTWAKRLLLGFPQGSPLAAFMPAVSDLYMDPLSFKANMADGDLIYESFTLTVNPTLFHPLLVQKSKVKALNIKGILAAPDGFEKALAFGLLRPSWFNATNKVDNTFGPKTLNIPFGNGSQVFNGLDFKAIASTHKGWMKMDLEGYSPDHYDMPGYMKQIYGMPLTIRFDGKWLEPVQRCTNNLPGMEHYGCKYNGESKPKGQQYPVTDSMFSSLTSEEKYIGPWLNGTASVQITGHECLTYDELQRRGYVVDGVAAAAEAQAMMPEAAKFCIVSGYFVGNGLEPEEFSRQKWAQVMGSGQSETPSRKLSTQEMSMYLPASLTAGPYPIRRASATAFFPEETDVTDHIYVGARPGSNAQDLMQPFAQMGIDVSPDAVFNTETANYKALYEFSGAQ